jgi:transmembrane protein TMEM260 (protein O-mannosyltransferase)
MNFNKVNNIVGWMVCLFACTVYIMTMEATGSFWDCGEFVSSCYKLQIPHPPGAPLFVLMGRFFIILFGDSPTTAARGVNFMSAITSGFSILFLFWSITHFARKLIQKTGIELTSQQLFTIMSAGVVGAVAYTFCDSFWYSAVEGEVYASSAFFTALVFWSILKWENNADKPGSDKWIIFIFFMMGLSIGVHLLNLLTIPAVVMVYYFKRYKTTTQGTILAFIIGCAITGFVQKFVIQYTIKGAAAFDIFFVNTIGTPFFVGFAFFFILLTALIILGIRIAVKRKYHYLKLAMWSFAFMLLGYSTYFTTMIRSNADPAVDMFNVDNPVSLVGYLSRDQYGDWPLIYGPDFTYRAPQVNTGDLYVKGKDKYIIAGKTSGEDFTAGPSDDEIRSIQKQHPDWDVDKLKPHLFPRMWDNGNDRQQVDCYHVFSGLADGDQPTMMDNIKYFVRYQNAWMYLRYFMWSYSGKQNDLEGFGNPRDGNAITGISFIDNLFLGDQSKMPDSIHTNSKSYNRLFMLPLILGFMGLIFHYSRNKKDFLIAFLLFFFTGFAIVVYLNQAGYQPRERDYAYAGSCYAFAIWIGLGVIWVKELFEKIMKAPLANYTAAGLCFLAVPVLMGQQEWDDHDRSKKTLARDLAKDYLESCPPNAMLFSFGDNDTYPLWYAQEVEGIRPDVRVVVNSLLGTDWYMNQLRYKVNNSAPFDIIFTPEQIQGNNLNVAYSPAMLGLGNFPEFDQTKYYDLYTDLKDVISGINPKYTRQTDDGSVYNVFPVRKFSVPVDESVVRGNGTVHPGDSVVNELHIDISKDKNFLAKNDLAIYAVIAANKWKRPICFTSTQELNDLGLQKYVRMTGLAYQLVPVESSYGDNVDIDVAYKNIMEKFAYGNADKKGVYYDEENRRHLNSIRMAHSQLAMNLIQAGKKDSAKQVLEHFDQHVLESNFLYGMTSNRGNQHDQISAQFLQACYQSGDLTLAKKVSTSLKKDLQQQMRYYKSFGEENMSDDQLANNAYMILQGKGGSLPDKQVQFVQDIFTSYRMLMQMADWEKQYVQGGANPGIEKSTPLINNTAPPSDSKKKK